MVFEKGSIYYMKIKILKKNMPLHAKAAIWFIICSFLQKGISFITVPIFARIMSTSQYGIYSLYISWFQVLTLFTSLNLFYGTLDNGMVKFEKDRDKYISSMQGLTITLTTIVFIIYLLFSTQWHEIIRLSPIYIYIMFIEMFVGPSLSFWSGRQRFEYTYKKLVFVTLIKSIFNPVFALGLMCFFSDKALGRILAIVIVEIIISGFLMIRQFKKGKSFFHKKYWKYALHLSIPMLPHYLAGTILNQGDRIMIEKIVNMNSVAYYSIAYSIGMLMNIFTSAINSAITPYIYQKLKSKNLEGVKELINIILFLIACISICMILISPELILLFGSNKYSAGQYVIPPIIASVYFIFLYGIFSLPQFYYEKTKFLMLSSVCAALLNIILNFIFIKAFGFIAAAYTTLICYILYSIGHYVVSVKVLSNILDNKSLFDIKIIGIISIILILMVLTINFLFSYIWIRLILILIILLLIVFKKNIIFNSLITLKKKQ